jgi:hypothetical protein
VAALTTIRILSGVLMVFSGFNKQQLAFSSITFIKLTDPVNY